MAEKLFWGVLNHLKELHPRFAGSKAGKRLMHRFNRTIHLVDSTTIQLVASCMDWAKQRRRKAAAKCHLRLDLQSFLPRFAIIDTAKDPPSTVAAKAVVHSITLPVACVVPGFGTATQTLPSFPSNNCRRDWKPAAPPERRRRGIFVDLAQNGSSAPWERHHRECRS